MRAGGRDIPARLAAIGLRGDWDFVLHLPLRYEDETVVVPIDQLHEGLETQVEAVVTAAAVVFRGRRQLRVTVQDEPGGTLVLRFLHFYSSQVKQLAVGQRVRAFGMARGGLAGMEMVHPRVRTVRQGDPLPAALTPIYPSTAGVPQSWLRKRIERALATVDQTDVLRAVLRDEWPTLPAALRRLHQPPPDADARALTERTDAAWQRLKFDELVAQQIALRQARVARQRHRAPALRADGLAGRLLAALPFRLTRAQQRVWREIEADLAREHPMQRLVQGDVGSGKTVIAALAAARAIESGWQAALMAPTELLAEQHFGRIASNYSFDQQQTRRGQTRRAATGVERDGAARDRHPRADSRRGELRPARSCDRR